MKSEKIRNKSTDKNNPRQSCDGITNCTSFQLLTIVKNLTIRLFVLFPKKCRHFLGALLNASCVWSQKRKNKRKGDTFQTCFENEQKRNFFFGAPRRIRTLANGSEDHCAIHYTISAKFLCLKNILM